MIKTEKKCVIFDCNGTLIDSELLCCQALVDIFSNFDANITLAQCMDQFKGGKLADILVDTQQRFGLSISLDILEPMYRQRTQELFALHLTPMPGALDLIHYLDQYNIEYCIAANAPKSTIESALSLTELLPFFKGKIYSAFDANSWKPDPDLLAYTIMNMGFLADECLYIDDTVKGVEAGLNANVDTLKYCYRNTSSCLNEQRVTCIHALDEVPMHLGVIKKPQLSEAC